MMYRFLISFLLGPLMFLAWRKGTLSPERFGIYSTAPSAPHLWLHGASNGELASARLLINAILSDTDRHLLITVNTGTARNMVAGWALPRVTVCLAPFDLKWGINRLIDHFQVSNYVGVEAEFWPNRFQALRKRDVPLTLIGARLSPKTAARIAKFSFARKVLKDSISAISPQDAQSAMRFSELGIDSTRVGPVRDLKAQYQRPTPDPRLEGFATRYANDTTLLAASVHVGEDIIVAESYLKALHQNPDLHLILAPRHPDKITPLLAWLDTQNVSYVRHSLGQKAGTDTQITIADTLGEMPLWYDLASVCFVGGSLVEKGGHTPFEPMAHDCAVLHGPWVGNFAETYDYLDAKGASRRVENAQGLTRVLNMIPSEIFATQRDIAAQSSADQSDFTDLIDVIYGGAGRPSPQD